MVPETSRRVGEGREAVRERLGDVGSGLEERRLLTSKRPERIVPKSESAGSRE